VSGSAPAAGRRLHVEADLDFGVAEIVYAQLTGVVDVESRIGTKRSSRANQQCVSVPSIPTNGEHERMPRYSFGFWPGIKLHGLSTGVH
jgi:hypothetical protein